MTPQIPDGSYVTWSAFEWLIGVFASAYATVIYLLFWIFNRHLREDDIRFDLAETRIEAKHKENVASLANTRADLIKGQSDLSTQMLAMRREIVDVLLHRKG